jgi:SAM-dependent methyltransferase
MIMADNVRFPENGNEYIRNTQQYYNKRFGSQDVNHSELTWDEKVRWNSIKKEIEEYKSENNLSSVTILDFGCGRGWLSNLLNSYGTVTGIDLADEAIKKAKQKYPGIEFINANAASENPPELANRMYDIVVSSEVIEHVSDQKAYFANLTGYVKKGGMLVLTTPNRKWFNEWFAGERESYKQPYEYWLTSEDLIKLAAGSFIKVKVTSFYSEWLFNFKSKVARSVFANRYTRKIALLTGSFDKWIKSLNSKGYGLYLMLRAIR